MTTVEELRAAYDAVRADLLGQGFPCPVEVVRDPDGRYILLEALTALVIAEAGGVLVKPGQTLVVGLPESVSLAELDSLASLIRERDPGFKVLYFSRSTHFAVVEGLDQAAADTTPPREG